MSQEIRKQVSIQFLLLITSLTVLQIQYFLLQRKKNVSSKGIGSISLRLWGDSYS